MVGRFTRWGAALLPSLTCPCHLIPPLPTCGSGGVGWEGASDAGCRAGVQAKYAPAQLLARAVDQDLGVMVLSAGSVPVGAPARLISSRNFY